MSRLSSTAALAYDETHDHGAVTQLAGDKQVGTWRPDTLVRVVRNDSVVHFMASSRGQARQLLDQALDLLVEMDARRALRSHLHPSWPR